MAYLYIIMGFILVIAFIGAVIYYFNPKNKKEVESAKYKMLDDE